MSHGEVKRADDRRLLKHSSYGATCTIDGCDRKHKAMGLCNGHYKRMKRYGMPDGGGTIRGEPERYLAEVVLPYRGAECLILPFARTNHGYGQIGVSKRPRKVHQIACAAAHGPRPSPTMGAAHSCGNGHLGCVNPAHLRWATHAENMRDMVSHGRARGGSR